MQQNNGTSIIFRVRFCHLFLKDPYGLCFCSGAMVWAAPFRESYAEGQIYRDLCACG